MAMTPRWLLVLVCVSVLAAPMVGFAQPPADPEQRERAAEEALSRLEGLENEDVEVAGENVTVRGEADGRSVIQEAGDTAQRITGAATLDNQVELTTDVQERLRGAQTRVESQVEGWLAYLPLIPVAAVVMLIAAFIAWLIGRWDWPFRRIHRNPFLREIAQKVVQAVVLIIGLLLALEILEATALVGGVLGAAGVAGIAIGFAFRDLVENYIASILLSLRQPFRMRDHVVIDGHEGLVSGMNTRTTVLTTFDGNVVRIPNATVFKTALINYTTDPRRRFEFDVGVGYDVDLGQAIEVGVATILGTPGVLRDPEAFGLVTKLGDSSITLRLFGWVNQSTHDFGRVRSAAMQRVKVEYDRLDIDMPEPGYRISVGDGLGVMTTPAERAEIKPRPAARDPGEKPARAARETTAKTPPRPSPPSDVHRVTRDGVVEELSRETEASGSENLLGGDGAME